MTLWPKGFRRRPEAPFRKGAASQRLRSGGWGKGRRGGGQASWAHAVQRHHTSPPMLVTRARLPARAPNHSSATCLTRRPPPSGSSLMQPRFLLDKHVAGGHTPSNAPDFSWPPKFSAGRAACPFAPFGGIICACLARSTLSLEEHRARGAGAGGRGGDSDKKPAAPSTYDSLAGRSKVLAPSASSRGRGVEPHSCRPPLPSARADPLPVCYASCAKAAQERGWRPTFRHPAIAASSGVVRACAISNWDPKIQHAAVLRDRQPCLGMARASPPPRPPHPRPARGPACTMVKDRLGKPQGAASLIGEHRNQIYIANPLCPRPHGREGPFALSIKIEPATLHAPPGPVRCPHEQGVRGDSAARNT